MRRGWRGASVALVAAVVLGAGCSSSSDSGSGSESSTTTAASGTSAPPSSTTTKGTTPTSGGGAAAAEGALIAASDLGSGWKMDLTAGGPSMSISKAFLGVPACADLVPDAGTGADAEASAQADYTTDASVLQVQYQVDLYPTDADAEAVVELFESPQFASCLGAALAEQSGSSTASSGLTTSPLAIASASDLGVDDAVGVEGDAQLSDAGKEAGVQLQVVILRKGSAVGAFTVSMASAGGTPPPIQVNEATGQAAAEKLAAVGS